ncbi:hypothetical protein D3C85_506110 [compost metagenome]
MGQLLRSPGGREGEWPGGGRRRGRHGRAAKAPATRQRPLCPALQAGEEGDRQHQPRSRAPAPGYPQARAERCPDRRGPGRYRRRARRAGKPLQGPGSAAAGPAPAVQPRQRGGPRGRRQGAGNQPRQGGPRLPAERHGPVRQARLLFRQALGIPRRRSARGQHRGRHLPGHLRHGDDDPDHGRDRHPLRRDRCHLPARVRQAGRADPRDPHRGEQPGGRSGHRLRRVRPGLLRLRAGRLAGSPVLPRVRSGADLRHPGPALGLADPGDPRRAGGDRRHRGRPGADSPCRARRLPGPGRDQGRDPLEGRPAHGQPGHDDRPDPRRGPRRR